MHLSNRSIPGALRSILIATLALCAFASSDIARAQPSPPQPTSPAPAPAPVTPEPEAPKPAAWYDKIKLSGFIQGQFIANEASGDGVDAQGRPASTTSTATSTATTISSPRSRWSRTPIRPTRCG